MAEIEISAVKMGPSIRCKCGRPLILSDLYVRDHRIEIVCSACHTTVVEIELNVRNTRWG